MSSEFKITTWSNYDTMQLRTATQSLFLDEDDVKKLREYFHQEKRSKGGAL